MRVHMKHRGLCGSPVTRTVAAACLLAGASPGAPEGSRTAYPLVQTELKTPSFCYLQSPVSSTKPDDAGAMPAFEAGKVSYLELRLGDGEPRLLAVEPLDRNDKTGLRVYLDTDGDRALTDETPCETFEDPKLPYRHLQYTPPLALPVVYRLPEGKVTHDCRFRLGFYPVPRSQQGSGDRVFYYAQLVALQGWTGTVAFGDKTLRLTVFDGDGDGKTEIRSAVSRDQIRLEGPAPSSFNRSQCLTRCLDLDGILYRLEIRPDGAEATVSRYTDETSTVAWQVSDGAGKPAEFSRLSLVGENLSVVCDGAGATPTSHTVPPGQYYLNYSIGKDKQRAYFRAPKPIEVFAKASERVACGGPVTLTVNVSQQNGQDETTLQVNINAANAANHAFQVSGAEQAGKVEISGPDGAPLGTGNMEYG